MPNYDILGLNVFIPDLNDLVNAVVQPLQTFIANALSGISGALNVVVAPLETFITDARDYIVNALTAAFNTLLSLPSTLYTFFTTTLPNALSSVESVILNALSGVANAVAGLPGLLNGVGATLQQALTSFVSFVVSGISSVFTPALNVLYNDLIRPAFDDLKAFLANPLASLSALGSFLQSSILALGSTVTAQIGSVVSSLGNGLVQVEHTLSNVGESVNTAFNQLATGLNSMLSGFATGLGALAQEIWQAFNQYVIQPASIGLAEVSGVVGNAIAGVQNTIKQGLVALLPRTPDAALNSALAAVEIGIGATLAGEVVAILGDFLHPIKRLGIQDALHKALDIVGITSISAAMYGIVVESGWGLQLQYYFNNELQPRRIDDASSQQAVYYGTRTLGQYESDLRYEGYNPDAIASKVSTLYQPINARMLVSLFEGNFVSDDFILAELRKEGFDPSQVNNILQALQFRAMAPFAADARTLVFTMYKDGYMDVATATNVMTLVGTPKTLQTLILKLGDFQFAYEQKLLAQAYTLDLVKKAVLAPEDGEATLTGLGMNAERAHVLIQIAIATALPSPTKAERQALLASLTGTA